MGSGLSAFRDAGLLSDLRRVLRTSGSTRSMRGDHGRAARRRGAAASTRRSCVRAKDNVKGSLMLGLESTWQPGGVPGPPGDLLRRALHARGDAGGHRCASHARRCGREWPATC
ncbi:MAG: hypothetical protein MZV64_04590 [Ignavibacteriales bacterium]|nr:hypothetical protein [Ignavibacteriales bacterium]